MNEYQKSFIMAISKFIHNDTIKNINLQLDSKQWHDMYNLSKEHSLAPVVYEIFKETPEFLKQDISFKNKWKNESISLVIKQIQISSAFLEIYQKIKTQNIDCIVTKGIILRHMYEKKEWRVSGDEDIIIKKEDYQKVVKIFLDNNFKIQNELIDDNIQVTTFIDPVSNLHVELHLQLFGKDTYLGFLNDYFKDIFINSKTIEIDNTEIQIMNENDQLLYLICHCFKHFINNGVGLRQLMDIAMYSKLHYQTINWDKLINQTKNFNGETFVYCLYSIFNDYFEIKYDDINYPNNLRKKVDYQEFLDDIFDSGVFGLSYDERIYSNLIVRRVLNQKQEKTSLISLIFPSVNNLRSSYPILYKKPYLLPYIWFKRMINFSKRYSNSKKNNDLKMKKAIELGNKRVALLKKYKIIK